MAYFDGWQIAQGVIRSDVVVIVAPLGDDVFCVVEISRPMFVQAAFSKRAIEAFHEGILSWLTSLHTDSLFAQRQDFM